jgi:large subunit ribosomal protein L25
MSDQPSSALAATRREPSNSREVRRLRRAGFVPGVVYGGGEEPVAFQINARELRNALAKAGTVIDLELDGAASGPVVLKELVRHPVTGDTTHLDLLRINLNVKIHAPVTIELIGAEDGPGVKSGGILEHILREVTVEALPNDVPESLSLDVSKLDTGDTITLSDLTAPEGAEIIGDPDAAVVTITQSRASRATGDEIETETELVGDEPAADGEADAEASADADAE